jgi:flagellar basal body-associated protein FliL
MTNDYRTKIPIDALTVERHRDRRTSIVVIGAVAVLAIVAGAVYFTLHDQSLTDQSATQSLAAVQQSRVDAAASNAQAQASNVMANAIASQAHNDAAKANNNAGQADNDAAQNSSAPAATSPNSQSSPN